MKKLVIAEKPSVAKDIARVLNVSQKHKHHFENEQYIVTWAYGHLLTLKMPEDIDKEWAKWDMNQLPMIPKSLDIKPLPKTKGQLYHVKSLLERKDVESVIIATDAGREGELVARWILKFAHNKKPIERLWISSQTDKSITLGFKQLKDGKQFESLYYSALARSKADWLIGLNVTRALTVKYDDNLSAGRVQTPTLAFVRQQEQKMESFVPKQFYSISVTYQQFSGKIAQSFETKALADAFVLALENGKIIAIDEKIVKEKAPLPYDLTTLQREANQKFGFSAKKTLSLLQSLYDYHKVTTYPRTDSQYLTEDMIETMKERLLAIRSYDVRVKDVLQTGAKVVQKAVFNAQKVGDHHAIIPTELPLRSEKASQDELKIYRLIVQRFVQLFLPAYETKTIKLTIQFQNYDPIVLQNKVIMNKGWKSDSEPFNEHGDHLLKIGQSITCAFNIKKETTTPPKALSEGQLLGKMEQFGLGTPATRAEIIERLVSSELMSRESSGLRTTPKGKQLLQLVNPQLVSHELTAQWEKSLEKIAKGQEKIDVFLKKIESDVHQLVNEIKQSQQTYRDFSLTGKKCPDCGEFLKEKQGKDGKFYICSNQNCQYRRRKDPKVTNHRCQSCHKKMVLMTGEKHNYFRCVYCNISEKIEDKNTRQKKVTKHEAKRLMAKINQSNEAVENPFANALSQLKLD